APAATVDHATIRTGATHTARAPIAAPVSIVTPTESQSDADFRLPSGLIARGYVSFVSTTAGPMNTPSPSTAGSYTNARFWILQLSPIRTPAPTYAPRPTMQFAPSSASSRTCTWSQTLVP